MASCREITVTCPKCGEFTAHAFVAVAFLNEKQREELRAMILRAHQKTTHAKEKS